MPEVSIVIATYNRSHLLPRAIESARTAATDSEIIVVDNGCTDDTAQLCASMADIKLIRLDKNAGPGGGRNAGISASTGTYVSFLDDDDIRLPGSLDRQLAALDADPTAGFIYGRACRGDENCRALDIADPEEIPHGDIFLWLLKSPVIPCLTVVVRRKCLDETGLFDQSLPCADDWDLWIRLAERFKALSLPEPVGIYRSPSVAAGTTTSNFPMAYRTAVLVLERALQRDRAKTIPTRERRSIRRGLRNLASDMLIWTAVDALQNGAKCAGRSSILEALRLNPSRALRPRTFKLLSRCLLA